MNKIFKEKLLFVFLILQSIALIIIFTVTNLIYYYQKVQVAKSISESLRPALILNDSKDYISNLQLAVPTYFNSVKILNADGADVFLLGAAAGWPIAVSCPISSGSLRISDFTIVFYYSMQYPIGISFCVWILFLSLSYPIFVYERRMIRAFFNLKFENEKSILFSKAVQEVAHDIRSPLSTLNLTLGSLRGVDEEKKEILKFASLQISNILTELDCGKSELFRADGIDPSISAETSDLEIILERSYREKKLLWCNFPTNFTLSSDLKGVRVIGNETLLSRIFSNLLNNAFEALPSSAGNIILASRNFHDEIVVYIQDDGIGMDENTLNSVGKRGFTKGKEGFITGGSGIGISSAREKLDQISGSLKITSKIGFGTSVEVHLKKARII